MKNMDFEDTYASPEEGNVRYPSSARKSFGGWAYVYTKDLKYVNELARYHQVEVRLNDRWMPFKGDLPIRRDRAEPPISSHRMEDDPSDPNYEG